MIWEIIFILSIFCILQSYLFYPWIIAFLARNKKQNDLVFQPNDMELPSVSILLAAYNEELVIEEKIRKTFESNYPIDKIEFLIGSDASTDKTNEIIKSFEANYSNLKLFKFPGRTGKSSIINELVKNASNEIFILTDANVIFEEDTIYQLVKHYKNNEISLVGGNIINSRFRKDGISFQEEKYISRENLIKYQEGILWGSMIGAFGGCYSIRPQYYAAVPARFFMDDFYITMNVIENKGVCINELHAICYEDISNKIKEEFRRKVRISIGNFQNLFRYWKLIWPLYSGVSFSFVSHKILRWLGPFFLLLLLTSNVMLFQKGLFFQISLFGQIILLIIPLMDTFLRSINLHLNLLRFISHFYLMNLALLIGFFKFIKGVKSNIWQPTQRYQ
ncbi:MAG: glycosyltransferase [Bacteroidetes bacterium]|jgi:cellulose synthase/poly-beta-1,6-N-acetylglucosamine synthase-like glycosyltransferase|nr:glycosyltransferase [Bacteroidota bacterium]MBT5530479.1 glycosyltransferase [Cytophagia bacterium]MBT3423110.1 glycosyltransferase [Bacteroidota bacterium]MBT3935832.1 glycosyltransferase [Bacteroidota bacterium]MBT4339024.1 glycosyltransferase [Bacteroidota bacterium]